MKEEPVLWLFEYRMLRRSLERNGDEVVRRMEEIHFKELQNFWNYFN